MAVPIWKDYFVSLGSVATQYFRIRVSSTTIYQGKAVRSTSSGNLYVRINDICADYMSQKVPVLIQSSAPGGRFPISFTVQKSSNGSSWTTVETVDFNDDWSYVTARYTNTGITATAYYGATTKSVSLSVNISTDFSAFYNAVAAAGKGRVEFDCASNATYSGKTLTKVVIGATTYEVVKGCPEFCLYYKNPFGGYDHLLLEGRCRKNRSGSRDTFVADYNNRVGGREEWTFQNEVTARYTLNTGFLTNEQSARMPYLLDSPDVYLVDLASPSVYIPVTIATDSYEVRKKKGADGMVNYTFEVAVSQKEYRR